MPKPPLPGPPPIEKELPAELAEIVKSLATGDRDAKMAAAAKLASLGEAAAPAKDALLAALKDEDPIVRAHAVRAIGKLGQSGVDAALTIAELVQDDDPNVRRQAVEALSDLPLSGDDVVPMMMKALQNPDNQVVLRALNTLSEFGERAVKPMLKALEDERTAYWACLVLTDVGPPAKDAVPKLTELLADKEHEEIRLAAANALRAIGPAAKAAVPALITALGDEQQDVRSTAALALGFIGPDAADAADELQQATQSDNELTKVAALWALEKVQPNEERLKTTTAQSLVGLLTSKDRDVRLAAANALLDLKPGPEVTAPLVAKVLENADAETTADILDAAASLGKAVVPRMVLGLDFEAIRLPVIRVLGRIGPDAAEAVPALLKYANDENPKIRAEVLFTLGWIGPAAKDGVDAAIAGLTDEEEEVRVSAVFALGKMGPAAVAAVDTLKGLLDGDDKLFAGDCAWALVQIDSSDEIVAKCVPLLIERLNSDQAFVRAEMANALATLGPKGKDALPALEKLKDDKDAGVREAVADAIKAIGGE